MKNGKVTLGHNSLLLEQSLDNIIPFLNTVQYSIKEYSDR